MDFTDIVKMFDSVFSNEDEGEKDQITGAPCHAGKEDRKITLIDCLDGSFGDTPKNCPE